MSEFFDEIIKFNIKGIPMIGNPTTGILIGLTQKGESFVTHLFTCEKGLDEQSLDFEDKTLYHALKDNGFLKDFPSNNTLNPKSAYVHINDQCNLHCKGCYSYVTDRNSKSKSATEQFASIFHQLASLGFLNVVISGGEPLLRFDLPQICKQAKESGIERLSVISNGTMPHNRYDRLIPYIDSLAVSVDGYNQNISYIRDPGIMNSVLNTICYVKDKIHTSIIVTLHRKNVDEMMKYVDLAGQLGVPMSFSIFTVDPNQSDLSDYLFDESDFSKIGKTLAIAPKEISVLDTAVSKRVPRCWVGCDLGRRIISVSSNGNIYPCHMLMNEACLMGNILIKSLSEILKSPVFNPYNIHAIDVEECRECQYRYVCGGGCPARSFLKYGDFCHKDPYCTTTKIYYGLIFDSLAQLSR